MRILALRRKVGLVPGIFCGLLCIGLCFVLWDWSTSGEPEQRLLGPTVVPSPHETINAFPSLWFERALTRNALASLRRVAIGFGLAAAIGIPIGILCGCFGWANAFFLPINVFGRNIPVAALIPLTFSLFGIGEQQKIIFIFIATVAFIIWDVARAIESVDQRYVDTAYTLGSSNWQVIAKVLVPLSLPDIFNSLRLLFGLAFGYIMLSELVKFGGESGGLGDIIITSQRRGPKEHIILVLLIIPVLALIIDGILRGIQKQLFPFRYGGRGYLHAGVRWILSLWDDCKTLVMRQKKMGNAKPTTPANAC